MSAIAYALEAVDRCVLCDRDGDDRGADLLFEVGAHGYWRCRRCRLVRLSPRVAAADLDRFYADTYGGYGTNPEPLAAQLRNPTFRSRARRIEREAGAGRSFYEVGCGDGNFLAVMRARGWRASGGDVSAAAVATARAAHGIAIDTIAFDALRLPSTYDAVGMYHVIEHLYDPRAAVRAVRRHLAAGGIFHVQMPNLRSVDGRLGGPSWFGLVTPQHVNLFEPDHLRQLLGEEGFDVLSVETYDPFHSPAIAGATGRLALRRLLAHVKGLRGARAPGPASVAAPAPDAPPAPLHARGRAYRAGTYVYDRLLARAAAFAESRVGWGNIVDVVARAR